MAQKTYSVIVRGKVQGVFFRDSTRRWALKKGVTGWVRNRVDGSVEVMLTGETEDIGWMVSWLHEGPRLARVDRVQVEEQDFDDTFSSFEIVSKRPVRPDHAS